MNWLSRLFRRTAEPQPFAVEPASAEGTVMHSLIADLLNDRRKQRQSSLAKALVYATMFILPVILYIGILAYGSGFRFGPGSDVVGIVRIDGQIASDSLASADRVIPALKKAFESPRVKAIVLSIDSPGGAPVESERIARMIDVYKVSNPKPVVAVINNLGASAAYMIALHADEIYAGNYSLVGSVGAVLAGWDFHKALARVDIQQRVYASGNLKAMLNPYLPMTAEADKKAQELVQQMGTRFIDEMRTQRKGKLKEGFNYTSGEVWGGPEAKQLALIDDIGTLDEVIKRKWGLETHNFGPSNGGFMGIGASISAMLKSSVVDAVFDHPASLR
jgi:protease IV